MEQRYKKNNIQTSLYILFLKRFLKRLVGDVGKRKDAKFLLIKHSKDARILSPIKFNIANTIF